MIFVLYHDNCLDGIGARYAAWKKLGDSATYIGVQYNKPLPEAITSLSEEELKNTEVYIVDFSYSREVTESLHKSVGKLVVLDHHKSAKEALLGLNYAIFDMHKSGAALA